MSRSNRKVVPECAQALNQMKYEIAAELGLMSGGSAAGAGDTEFATELGGTGSSGGHVNWSQLATRDAGSVGGNMTRLLVQRAEQVLKGLS
ncbi:MULTISPECIES: alpha/beta-type small acid-soluble spore protein [Paenibacillus]|uniref:Alpha/beta-type small acid-soluble spore protein n=1 Tax=Paenibacillus lignilyticus TaxID=1172615 RepID=A0ABS5CM16_9BACL|nr:MULTISPECIES: alpha/beta-type small acid-soluble spore protein [Paenibacillus]MBP3966915.1 alpha/beta-type small acid-soluble spore protein [Paenibacillus lignilyticus]SFT25570.1 Small, acid-soluble spore protein, alpha/beta type [Paenibacillus sp. BC26]